MDKVFQTEIRRPLSLAITGCGLRRRCCHSDDAGKFLFVGVEFVDFDDFAANHFFVGGGFPDWRRSTFLRFGSFESVGGVDVVGGENDAPRVVVVIAIVVVVVNEFALVF